MRKLADNEENKIVAKGWDELSVTKRLYLDVCTLCRPLDDQDVARIRIETDAFFLILNGIYQKNYKLMTSAVHMQEIEAISEANERMEVLSLIQRLSSHATYRMGDIRKRSEWLYAKGLGVADAAHIAFAEAIADVFITCDDKLIKQCKKVKLKLPVLNPVEFVGQEDLK